MHARRTTLFVAAIIGVVSATTGADDGCYRLIPSGFVCGERETAPPSQNIECPNCPGLPTCALGCGGPAWEVYPTIISLCDNAVGGGMTICTNDSIGVKARKHFFWCDFNNCYALQSTADVGNACSSASLDGDECEGE